MPETVAGKRWPGHIAGITLVEVLIAMSIIMLLLGSAAPSLRSINEKKQGEKALNALAGVTQSSRAEAIRNGQIVTICRSRDGVSCSGSWSDGVIAFIDRNADRQINESDRLLHHVQFIQLPGTLTWRAFQNRQYLQIDQRGNLRYQNGNFTYCPHSRDARLAHQLIISSTGRLRWAMDTDGDGFREGSDGKSISCAE
jgi:type IV fimbrial biogenesis protein FimT